MTTEIRCSDSRCHKLLGVVKGAEVEIRCPRCNAFKRVAIVDLVAELQAYLASLSTPLPASGNGAKDGAGGFFL